MNCFNHHESPALGICKHCNKGICQTCLSDTGDGIACKGHCTEEVYAINKVIEHNKKVIKGTPATVNSSAILYVAMGGIFILFTLLYLKKLDPFTLSMGGLFLFYGLYSLRKGRVYKENPRDF